MSKIHPTAVVESGARLGEDTEVGPHCYVGSHVVLGARCTLRNHVTLTGHTTTGTDNVFYANAVIGEDPQDLKYRGEPTQLVIGNHNCFRESVTVHRGTDVGGGITRIGNDNHFMVGAHIAHDTHLGDHIILANNTLLAGHVHIEDRVTIAGAAAMHHFTTVGTCAFIGGMARITTDVPPFMIFEGYPARVRGLNAEGLSRWGFEAADVDALRNAYRELYGKRAQNSRRTLGDALDTVESNGALDDNVRYLVDFVRRSLVHGLSGRYRESTRTDKTNDRGAFYHRDLDSTTQPSSSNG